MKILYLSSDVGIPVFDRKGAAIHVRSLVTALSRQGHKVILAAPRLNGSSWAKPANYRNRSIYWNNLDVTLFQLPPSLEIRNVLDSLKGFNEMLGINHSLPSAVRRILYNHELLMQLQLRLEEDPPDFIYERGSLYATVGVSLSRELNVPLLIELNAPLVVEQANYRGVGLDDLASHAERWILSQANAVLAVSRVLCDYAVSLGINQSRVYELPNGVDPTLFRTGTPDREARVRWGLGEGPVLGFVGMIRPWHGIKALPQLLGCLVQRYRDLRLVIVGDGPLRGELESTLRDKGLLSNTVFTMSREHEEVAELIRHFDIALAPYSTLEHAFYFSPLKLFEYMACGVPVVAAAVGQISEVIRDGKNGLLYPPDDVDAMVAACDRLLSNRALREHLGQAAAKEIRERYTWSHNAARVVDIASSLIARPAEVRV